MSKRPRPKLPVGFHGAIEKMIEAISPTWALSRSQARYKSAVFSAYHPGLDGHRTSKSIGSLGGAADKHLSSQTLWALRERGRVLDESNTLAQGILQTYEDNVIGNGLIVDALTDDNDWNKEAEHFINIEHRWDIRRSLTNTQFQRIVLRTLMRDGDLALICRDGRLHPVEGDRIVTPQDRMRDPNVVNGVEMDGDGFPIAFWIARTQPTSPYAADAVRHDSKDVLHVWNPRRFSQTRGVSLTGQIFDQLNRLNDYVDATCISAQIAACFAVFIRQSMNYDEQYGANETNPRSGETERVEELEPGLIMYGAPGDEATQLRPEQPSFAMDRLVDTLCRLCGRHVNLPLELVLLNFSHSNFSNTRAAILQAQMAFRSYHHLLTRGVFRRVYTYLIREGIRAGRLTPRPDFWKHSWRPPSWPWLQPLQDVQADSLAVEAGFASRPDICIKRGTDYEDVDTKEARARENRKAEGLIDEAEDNAPSA